MLQGVGKRLHELFVVIPVVVRGQAATSTVCHIGHLPVDNLDRHRLSASLVDGLVQLGISGGWGERLPATPVPGRDEGIRDRVGVVPEVRPGYVTETPSVGSPVEEIRVFPQ